jgi:hypothetical protein
MLIDISNVFQPWKEVCTSNTFTLDVSFDGISGHESLAYTNDILEHLQSLQRPFDALIYREQLDKDGTWRPHLHLICIGADRTQMKELESELNSLHYLANTLVQPLKDKEAAYMYYTKQDRHHTLELEGWKLNKSVAFDDLNECTTPAAVPVPAVVAVPEPVTHEPNPLIRLLSKIFAPVLNCLPSTGFAFPWLPSPLHRMANAP